MINYGIEVQQIFMKKMTENTNCTVIVYGLNGCFSLSFRMLIDNIFFSHFQGNNILLLKYTQYLQNAYKIVVYCREVTEKINKMFCTFVWHK